MSHEPNARAEAIVSPATIDPRPIVCNDGLLFVPHDHHMWNRESRVSPSRTGRTSSTGPQRQPPHDWALAFRAAACTVGPFFAASAQPPRRPAVPGGLGLGLAWPKPRASPIACCCRVSLRLKKKERAEGGRGGRAGGFFAWSESLVSRRAPPTRVPSAGSCLLSPASPPINPNIHLGEASAKTPARAVESVRGSPAPAADPWEEATGASSRPLAAFICERNSLLARSTPLTRACVSKRAQTGRVVSAMDSDCIQASNSAH